MTLAGRSIHTASPCDFSYPFQALTLLTPQLNQNIFENPFRARSLKFRGRRGRSLGVDFVTCCKEHTEVCD